MAAGYDDAVQGRKVKEIRKQPRSFEAEMGSEELITDSQIFETPMCLVSTKGGKLQVEENALKMLEEINKPLVVVAIAGLYRTGKSYLMNRLAGVTRGFEIGSSVISVTKGIWAWCKKHPVEEDTILLLLDTEGLGDVEKGDSKHDNTILTLALLFSNIFVYNMMTAFNQDVLDKLTFITELSKHIHFKNKSNLCPDNNLDQILPTFVLCLRDFTLELKDKEGKQITADEYLEEKLKLKPGEEYRKSEYNRQRESIMKYFPKRKCFTIDNPGSRDVIKQLENLPVENISQTFIQDIQLFVNYIYNTKPKDSLIGLKPITGAMFGQLVCTYVKAMNEDTIPDVDTAIQVVARFENKRLATAAVSAFKEQMENITLPIHDTDELDKLFRETQTLALRKFRSEAVYDSEQYENQAMDEMSKAWETLKDENITLVKTYWKDLLKDAYTEVQAKVDKKKYRKAGGYKDYKADMDVVKQTYMQNVTKTNETLAKEVWYAFLEDETQRSEKIMEKDKKIKKEEKKMEADRLKREYEEMKRSQEVMFERRLREDKRRADEQFQQMRKEHEYQLKCERQQIERMKAEWDVKQEILKKEMELMKTERPKEMTEKYKIEIEALKQELIRKERHSRIMKEEELKAAEERNAATEQKLQEKYSTLQQNASKLRMVHVIVDGHHDVKPPKTKTCIIQ